jgi:hypothetical protein
MPLEGVSGGEWLLFDRVLMVRDLFTGGNRSFTSTQDAREFRAAVYAQYGERWPAGRGAGKGLAMRCCTTTGTDQGFAGAARLSC